MFCPSRALSLFLMEEGEDRMEGYLTTQEIARRLGVSVETVRHWVRQGKLPGLPLGPIPLK